jgi:uncharacterized protein (DUF1800 family)
VGTTIDATAAIRRLLTRTGFATTPARVEAAARAGFTATLDAILAGGPDAGVAATPPPAFDPLTRPRKRDNDARKAYRQDLTAQVREMSLWWLDRLVVASRPWVERRTLLWHGHWATSVKKVHWPAAMLQQNEAQRRLGGGNFDTFARAMVVDPALMLWLDASGNTAKAPNENLSRELMELFTLGHGNYTEEDVRQGALALTGWRIDRPITTPTAIFDPVSHATGTQTILGVTRDFTANDLVDLLVSRPASPRYLATRLWGWLVSADQPSEASLDRIAAAYGRSYDLTAMFRAIFADPAFRAVESVLVKSPIEYVVGALRSLGLRPSTLDTRGQRVLQAGLRGMGQVPFDPPNVGGWPVGTAWLTTAAAQARIQLAAALARLADISAVATVRPAARPDAAARLLGVGDWSSRTRGVLARAVNDPAELVTLALVSPEYTVSG